MGLGFVPEYLSSECPVPLSEQKGTLGHGVFFLRHV